MLARRNLLLSALVLTAGQSAAQPAPLQIYAAMTFRPALEQVLTAYRKTGGAAVAVYGPTPVLIRQLAAGAPADIVLTADAGWMDEAVRQGLVRPDTRFNLMSNDLILAGPAGTTAGGTIQAGFPLEKLLAGGRLAMCDPEHDPAGRYGKQSLQALGLWDAAATHLAIAESVPAAVVLVDRGEAGAAIAFRTDLHGSTRSVIAGTFPPDSHKPIVYPIALAKDAQPEAAAALAFLRSPQALQIFFDMGYQPAP